MGWIRHHAIVVTGDDEHIERAHRKATELGCSVSPVTEKVTNAYQSFLVAPDGSKEGWSESNEGDARRGAFKAWLRESHNWCSWVEVEFCETPPRVTDANNIHDDEGSYI